jgi:uncharacterized protein (TIGR00730 family)
MNEEAAEKQELTEDRPEIGVLGSARLGEDDERWEQARRLGELLANAGFAIVTGGYGGLMAAVSRGAHERGGSVIGLPMGHWGGVKPNRWNSELRWSTDYGTRINHLLHCQAIIALPGGVGTLSEMAMAWAAGQTEGRSLPLILLGACWPPLLQAIRAHLVVNDRDLDLLRLAASPEEALQKLQAGLQEKTWRGAGPHG